MNYKKYSLIFSFVFFCTELLSAQVLPTPAPIKNKEEKNKPVYKQKVKPPIKKAVIKPDSDRDGIDDESDDCPDQYGPTSNGGCPLPPPEKPKATLKITTDVDANLYIDGVLKNNLVAGTPFLLPLDRGFFDIKVVSAKYNVFELREAYKVENSSQMDYWKVQLKDDEDVITAYAKGKKMAAKAPEIISAIKECMYTNFTLSSNSNPISYEYYLNLYTNTIHYKRMNFTSTTLSKKRPLYTYISTAEASTVTRFEIVRLSEKVDQSYVIIYCKARYQTSRSDNEDNRDEAETRIIIYIKESCADDLKAKLTKIFAQ